VLRVDLPDAKPGMELALPVRNPRKIENILLRVGYTLDKQAIVRLDQMGIRNVWVRCPGLGALSKFYNEDIINTQTEIMQQITGTFERLKDQVNTKLPYQSYRKSMSELIHHLIGNPRAAIYLDNMADCGRSALITHISSVTYLSLLMGLKLEGYLVRQRKRINPVIAKEVIALGLGAMLHDIGVIALPDKVYLRFLETGDGADVEWQQHPALGYEIVRGNIDPSAATIVMNHHQRFDGSGYAGPDTPILEGERIHVFARIVALADQFDLMLNPPHKKPRTVVTVLTELLSREMSPKFDPHVMRALLSVVPPYPPGSRVRLSDGRCGVCIDHTPADPCRPVVQIVPDIDHIDPRDSIPGDLVELYEESNSLYVTECNGTDVSTQNFSKPSIMHDHMKGLILKRKGKVGLL